MSKTPISTLLNEAGEGESVRLGSFIYNIGGSTKVDEEDSFMEALIRETGHHVDLGASFFEFSTSDLLSSLNDCDDHTPFKSIRWNEAPLLRHDWRGVVGASLGDKIYAFGGSSREWGVGQEFNPKSGQWRRLPRPPSDLRLDKFCVSYPMIPDENNHRLLVHFFSANALYAYYPKELIWSCISSRFPRWQCATALVDDVLYAHEQGKLDCLIAYDLSKKLWLDVVYTSPIPLQVCKYQFINMLHLGNGVLCLTNDPPTFDGLELKYSNLQFFKFSVKRTSPTEVQVTPADMDFFPFDKQVKAIRFFAI